MPTFLTWKTVFLKVVYVADAKFGVGGDELLNGAQLEGQAQGVQLEGQAQGAQLEGQAQGAQLEGQAQGAVC